MYVHVRAIPGAKKEMVTKITDTEFQIQVREPAERNQANKRILQIIAQTFHTTPANVKMLTGHRSPSKMISVEVV